MISPRKPLKVKTITIPASVGVATEERDLQPQVDGVAIFLSSLHTLVKCLQQAYTSCDET